MKEEADKLIEKYYKIFSVNNNTVKITYREAKLVAIEQVQSNIDLAAKWMGTASKAYTQLIALKKELEERLK